ncbi:FCD domain-containing protein [Conexibacter sp. JD483]|uniref:FadR/GntR family transcriptional regulator n=1 Tax=unclassified Conexibacter TaxID=2627773 RepID=UPI0027239CE5|nr:MULTISPECIES: FCD domain-containing protein [unclassified Conexibacter]MDO8184980.1 FCD domain-containing protein [Conexibacter sp. CPCC 205706]MDO8198124.1 FCD domain-containing protein [Conexibacter sp. CPCC 205762]MDR9368254.1 FCD domain-containing protein [Conexibacter sp. JD483]
MSTLPRSSLSDQAAEAILALIDEDDLGAGDALPAAGELAKRFGVSVVVVREAIAALAGRGILVRSQGRETVVGRPGAEILDSILRVRMRQDGIAVDEFQQCRAALEAQSAVLAATAPDAAARAAALTPALDAMRAAQDLDAFREADLAFHLALAGLAGNQALLLLLEALNTVVSHSLGELWRRIADRDDALARTIAHHEAIAAAVAGGDRDAAARAMAVHFLESAPDVDYGIVAPAAAGATT